MPYTPEAKSADSFLRAKKMAEVSRLMQTFGISKTALADNAGISRSALSNKFSWAEAVIEFRAPFSRDSFSEQDATVVLDSLKAMADWVYRLLPEPA